MKHKLQSTNLPWESQQSVQSWHNIDHSSCSSELELDLTKDQSSDISFDLIMLVGSDKYSYSGIVAKNWNYKKWKYNEIHQIFCLNY